MIQVKENNNKKDYNNNNIDSSGFSGGLEGKESACKCRRQKRHSFIPWVRKIPWSRKWQHALVFLSGKAHGQRNLAGYSPCKEAETTQQLSMHTWVFNANVLNTHINR